MDAKKQATLAVELLTPLVEGTRPDQLSAATPCSKWAVRDLMMHFVGGGHMFAAAFRGEPMDVTEPPGDLLGNDHVAAYRAAVADFLAATEELASLDKPVELPIGTVPAEVALRIAAGDLLVHGWDLSQATGQPFDPPADFVGEADAFYRMAISPQLRDGDTFADEVDVAPSASALERLVAFAGRRP